MNKDYSKYFTPSISNARKRLNKETNYQHFQMEDQYIGLGHNRTYLVKTYGCQGNLADSEKIAGIMDMLGYHEVFEEAQADVVIFNTCAIRDNAEKRVFGELGRIKGIKETNPDALIVVCGCMPQEEATVELIFKKYDQVDILFGTHNIYKLPEYLYQAMLSKERIIEVMSFEGDIIEDLPTKRDSKIKAWVNIMYGCDEFCTYCIVPYTRGKERSRKPEDILSEVKTLIEAGYQEITLLGQNVNAYGLDLTDLHYTFADLLSDLQQMPIKRIRFTTSHPKDLDDATIEVMAKGKNVMPHLHLPVQSGSDVILKKMNRKYTKASYLDKIHRLREKVPYISLTTDIIVGFPGETDDDFQMTLDLVQEAQFEGAYTFIFSPREGTPASRYEDETLADVKKNRLLTLNQVINEGFARGHKRFEGQILEVLVDGMSAKNKSILTGYTPHNKVVNFEGSEELIGKIVRVKIEKAYTWHLKGILV